jgi:superfamily II DNA or RNA helicase
MEFTDMTKSQALAEVAAPARAAGAVTTSTGPAELPHLLQRPDERGAVAKLTWQRPGKDAKGEETDARWALQGSPLAVTLAGRIFSGAISRRNDRVSWPALPSSFEDVLMLMHRHAIEVAPTARPVWEEFYQEALRGYELRTGAAREVGMPAGGGHFTGTLMAFQQEGLEFMLAARKCLLADDMGLGKTPMALAFLDRIDDWPAVVVCQPHVQRHWETKIEEFLDCERAGDGLALRPLSWCALRGMKPRASVPAADLYLVHYLVLRGWDNWLKARGVRTVIFDEAQELRHPNTAKAAACRAIARPARNVVGLSGTPIYNRGAEIFTVMNALNRGCLGLKHDFTQTWCKWEDPEIVEDPALLGRYLVDRRLMLRRRKEDVMSELPEKRRVMEMIDADNEKFAALVTEARRLARSAFAIRDPFDRARMEAEALAGARMATGIAKAPAVALFLRGLIEAGEPTLVFAHHHVVQDTILEALDDIEPAAITGRQTLAGKAESQRRFVDGETDLCVIALRAATGLDGLQKRARCVVFAEFDWSPAIHRQAEDRAHRYGQRDSVLVYYLATDLGTDPFMLDALNVKQSQFTHLFGDREETEDDMRAAEEAKAAHIAKVLEMLRGS